MVQWTVIEEITNKLLFSEIWTRCGILASNHEENPFLTIPQWVLLINEVYLKFMSNALLALQDCVRSCFFEFWVDWGGFVCNNVGAPKV